MTRTLSSAAEQTFLLIKSPVKQHTDNGVYLAIQTVSFASYFVTLFEPFNLDV